MKKQKKEIRKYFLFPAIIVAALVLSGCGKSVSQKANEKIAEKIIESQSGGAADVDFDDDNVTVKTDKGKMEVGESVALPADFPSDVYVIEGIIKMAISDTNNNGHTISIETDKSIEDAAAAYQEKLVSDGWKIAGTVNLNDSFMITAEKNERSASVTINKSETATNVFLTVAKK